MIWCLSLILALRGLVNERGMIIMKGDILLLEPEVSTDRVFDPRIRVSGEGPNVRVLVVNGGDKWDHDGELVCGYLDCAAAKQLYLQLADALSG